MKYENYGILLDPHCFHIVCIHKLLTDFFLKVSCFIITICIGTWLGAGKHLSLKVVFSVLSYSSAADH